MKGGGIEWGKALCFLSGLWTEENVTLGGKYYQVDNVPVARRPVQRPRPPIWFGAWAEPAIRRAARLGDTWLIGPSASFDEIAPCLRTYRETSRVMRKGEGDVALLRYVFVASSTSEAIRSAGDSFIAAFER